MTKNEEEKTMLNKIILIGRMTRDPERAGRDPEKPIANTLPLTCSFAAFFLM